MPFAPRSDEVAAVAAILNDESFEDATAMGRAIVRAVVEQIAKRETYVIFPRESPIGYGVYFSETDAARAWKKEIGSSFAGQGRLLRVFAWAVQDEQNAGCECGHVKEQHVIPGPKNKPGKPSECGRIIGGSPCPCPSFTPRKAAS